jgi:type II secretory pathway pseudopilin PulG
MKRAPEGFTFIELIIAGTMIAILFVGLAAHLRGGITVWREATRRIEALEEEQSALEGFARDLAQAVRYYADESEYGPSGLPAPQFGPDGARWYAVDPVSGVRLVSYGCQLLDDVSWWVRTSQSLEAVRLSAEPPAAERLLAHCERFALRYAYLADTEPKDQLNWQAVWPDNPADPAALPRLLEMRLTRLGRRGIQRVLAVPHGLLEAYAPAAGP